MKQLEQIRSVLRSIQDPSNTNGGILAKIVSNIKLKPLATIVKKFILDAWLGPECDSADGCNAVVKIETEPSPW